MFIYGVACTVDKHFNNDNYWGLPCVHNNEVFSALSSWHCDVTFAMNADWLTPLNHCPASSCPCDWRRALVTDACSLRFRQNCQTFFNPRVFRDLSKFVRWLPRAPVKGEHWCVYRSRGGLTGKCGKIMQKSCITCNKTEYPNFIKTLYKNLE